MGSSSHSSKRKKKRSQKRSKKRSKSIKAKSKKLKRRSDSFSCSDGDNLASASSVSRSGSSSEDDYRSRRKARSRDRRDTRKGSKKRIKRDSSMSDSSGDSRVIKKRKRSKRKRDFDSRKKLHGKKRRREPSSSSFSDQSRSGSMSESSDDNKREVRKEEKREMKERYWGEKGREKIRSKRSKGTSRSCSPCSLRSENHSYGSQERVMEDSPPKRLKSVIVVLRELEEAEIGESIGDEHKDEIVYEADDYPTRSNDSNDGMSRGEALPSSHDASDEKMTYLEEPNGEAGSSDVGTSKFSRIQRLDVETTGGIASSSVEFGFGDHTMVNRSEVSSAVASSKSIDVEAMLRQKALQNLLKRQGKLPTKTDVGNQGDHPVEVKNPDGGSSASVQKVGKNDNVKHTSSVTGPPKDTVVHSPIKKLGTGHPVEKAYAFANPIIGRPKLDLSTSTRRLLGRSNTWRRDPTSQGSPRPNLSSPKDSVNKDSAKGIESQSSDTKTVVENADISAASKPPASVGKSTKDEANEADDDSDFEQKTMTVMRGGELVQVSYKVKIPKKAPALARRQLKR